MKYIGMMITGLVFLQQLQAQPKPTDKLQASWNAFSRDQQLKYASIGFCVMDANTGKILFEKNSNTGLAPASTQKVITSIAAFEALGAGYQFPTRLGYTGKIVGRTLQGDLVLEGNGDPSFASTRYTSSNADLILRNMANAIKQAGIDSISGNLVGTDKGFDLNPVPDGWIWSDIGNYYGAGHWAINWNENQYDLFLKTGRNENDGVQIAGIDPGDIPVSDIINDVKTGKTNTGDGSILYAAPYSDKVLFQGKLEPGQSKMRVSGAITDAPQQALTSIQQYLSTHAVYVKGSPKTAFTQFSDKQPAPSNVNYFYSNLSPTLDSMVYWFMKKSINLYGEAFIRTIGLEKKGFGSIQNGLDWVNTFYTANGFDSDAMHLYDGSGLSPANRITPAALANALYMARGKKWFPFFYDALPVYNGMKLKSGTINRVKCYAGYHSSKSGNSYIVTLMVNNYNGSPSALVGKMFDLLNDLK